MLTKQQLSVLNEAAKGLSWKEIGANLNIKMSTVNHHMTAIHEKLGPTTVQAVLKAIELGMLPELLPQTSRTLDFQRAWKGPTTRINNELDAVSDVHLQHFDSDSGRVFCGKDLGGNRVTLKDATIWPLPTCEICIKVMNNWMGSLTYGKIKKT